MDQAIDSLIPLLGLAVLIILLLGLAVLIKTLWSFKELKQKVQRLQDQFDEFKDRSSSFKSTSGTLGQSEQQTDIKPEATQPMPVYEGKPPPIIDPSKPASPQPTPALDQAMEPIPITSTEPGRVSVESVAKPGEPAKPEPVAASEQAESPLPAKVDAESIEMKLGTYWFVRIGVMLVLTGLGILAYYKKQFFIDLSPGARVSLFYLLSAVMGGVGFWLQHTKEKLKNYGHVLVAGGCAGVYFTTYAAHIFEPVQVIMNPTAALLLLFAWGGFMVWFADRIKSETVALFATGASYYATYVPLIHTGEMSQWVFLFSNLILALAVVVFMLRNRWLKMPVLGMLASYGGFHLWRMRVDEPLLPIVVIFAVSLWVVYTAAVFLSRNESLTDRQRAAFLTTNNAAMFGLLTIDVLKVDGAKFWILPMAVGIALLGCALAAAKFLKDQSLARKSYLTQGLVLVTLGLMTMGMADSIRGPILAAESVVLLFMAIRRENLIYQVGSLIVVAIAAVYALQDTVLRSEDFLLGGLFTSAIFLFNSWLCHQRVEAANKSLLRPRVSYLTGLGLVVGLVAFLAKMCLDKDNDVVPLQDWVPVILLATTVLFTGSVYRLKLREFLMLGQVPVAIGLLFALDFAASSSEFTWSFFCALVLTLGQAHWWWWQRDKLITAFPDPKKIRLFPSAVEAVLSGGFVFQLFAWMTSRLGFEWETWLWTGSLIAVGVSVYALITRARFIGLFSQTFLGMSCLAIVVLCVRRGDANLFVALIPIATLLLMNAGASVPGARIGQLSESATDPVRIARFGYRGVAAVLGLLWIGRFVAGDSVMLVYVLVGVALFLGHGWKQKREWFAWALVYAVVGLIFLLGEFSRGKAHWQSVTAIIVLFGVQQLAHRRQSQFSIPELSHRALILVGGAALFLWLSVKVSSSEWGGDGLRTIAWTILGVGYFGLGLGLKERWHRLMGLGTLVIALASLVPIIWQMSNEMKIASFFVMGLVFIGLGFVYTRFKEQIRKLL